jgi:hypothetical protein
VTHQSPFFLLAAPAAVPVLPVVYQSNSIASPALSLTRNISDAVPARAAVDESAQAASGTMLVHCATLTRRLTVAYGYGLKAKAVASDIPVATVTSSASRDSTSTSMSGHQYPSGTALSSSAGFIPITNTTLAPLRPNCKPRQPRLARVNVGPTVSYNAPK